ncbi:putative MFS family arabinose efflux permease [Nitrosospira sp. Nsp2]|uniref:MFS transporter n=1 Tax=Nitrosospira sp. Nsp2 TaxID=136548 RepID=UPI000D2FB0E6|nr:MFS transporter [Nitrosospira sp. Nsp2]PTR17572.1 putative MFS family arabinose efflux permease [Nitrosospira sp. Nsp2]
MMAIWFRVVLVLAMAMPMLVLYAISALGPFLTLDLHFKPELLGYLLMSSFGLAAVLSLWAGAFVDRVGTRYSLIVLFSTIAFAFTLIATVQNFYGLLAATAICGIAQALANPVTNLLITQQVPAEKKAKAVGLKQAGVQLAALFAGLVLPGIALRYGWPTAFGLIVPVAVLLGIAAPLFTPGKHSGTNRGFSLSPPNSLLMWLIVTQFCVGVSLSAFVTFLPTFAARQGMPLSLAGSLIAVFGVMGVISRIVLTPIGAKLKDESALLLLLIAIAACAIAVTMHADLENHWLLWIGAASMGLTAAGTNAIAMSMLVRDPKFGPVTITSGYVSVGFFSGFALGPPLFGVLSSSSPDMSSGWVVLIGVLMAACLTVLALASARRRKTQALAVAASHGQRTSTVKM